MALDSEYAQRVYVHLSPMLIELAAALVLAVALGVWLKRRALRQLVEQAEAEAGTATAPAPLVGLQPATPARTTAIDALDYVGADEPTKAFLALLRDCPTPNLDDERLMAVRLAGHLAAAGARRVRVQQSSGPDIVYEEHVAAELKRPRNGEFSASEIDRACGQIVKYAAAWPGPLVLVLFSRSAPALDTRLRQMLADPALRARSGGALLVVWKARGHFKVVAPGA